MPPDIAAASDAGPDAPGECDPGCHWDCFGGAPVCGGGDVWLLGIGARECCYYDEPWPGPGPECGAYCAPVRERCLRDARAPFRGMM